MPRTFDSKQNNNRASLEAIFGPVDGLAVSIPPLKARGNRPLQMEFMHQLKALILFHLEEHTSGRDLLQFLEEDDYARKAIAPSKGIKKSAFFEAINTRGIEQLLYVFHQLQAQATKTIPQKNEDLGELIAIDGSYVDSVLSMHWADYSDSVKKAKAHVAFDLNRSIPSQIVLTNGKVDERPFVGQLLCAGQTGVMDRGYQSYTDFDLWQSEGRHFVCRIRIDSQKTIISSNPIADSSIVFYDAVVLLGIKGVNQTQRELRVVGYRVEDKEYWIATDRFDLSAEQLADVYKARWAIEKFFAWWKRHLKVYHLIARSRYGLTVQLLAGLITYLLLALYCHQNFAEPVSIRRVRQLRNQIRNELRGIDLASEGSSDFKEQEKNYNRAIP